MKYTPLTQTNLFENLDEIIRWLGQRSIPQGNRLHIYRKNLIAMRDHDIAGSSAELYTKTAGEGRINEMLASHVEGEEMVDALICLRDRQIDIPQQLLRRAMDGPPRCLTRECWQQPRPQCDV